MIFSKCISKDKDWRKAFSQLESISGFEPMHQHDVDSREMTLKECWDANIAWLHGMVADCVNIATPFNESDITYEGQV